MPSCTTEDFWQHPCLDVKTHRIWQKVHLLLSENQVVQDCVHQYYDQYVEYLLSAQLTSEPSHWIEERSIAPSSNIPGRHHFRVGCPLQWFTLWKNMYTYYTYIIIRSSQWLTFMTNVHIFFHTSTFTVYTLNTRITMRYVNNVSIRYQDSTK